MKAFESYWDLIDPVWDRVNIYDGVEAFEGSIVGIPRPMLIVYAAHFCLSEVRNGGFLQLFWNSTGILIPESMEGFQAVGMPLLANTFASATATFRTPFPRDRQERWDALEKAGGLSDSEMKEGSHRFGDDIRQRFSLDPLERQIYKLADEENGGFETAATAYANTLTQ